MQRSNVIAAYLRRPPAEIEKVPAVRQKNRSSVKSFSALVIDGGDVGGHAPRCRHSPQRTLSGAAENNYAVAVPSAHPDSARLAKRLRRPAGHLDLLELAS